MKPPNETLLIRPVDNDFVDNLKEEIKTNPLVCPDPLLCIVPNIPSSDGFNDKLITEYEYETLGGNHRRTAYQSLLEEKAIKETTLIPARLVFGMLRFDNLFLNPSWNKRWGVVTTPHPEELSFITPSNYDTVNKINFFVFVQNFKVM